MILSLLCKLTIVFITVKFSTCKLLYSNLIKEVKDDIIKSPYDKRSFRALTLVNDMKVLLVHDQFKAPFVELDIRAGYLNDPKNLHGVAEFLAKHTLPMAKTLQYPRGDFLEFLDYNQDIGKVSTDHTSFSFETSNEKLSGALERFAQLLISPQFSLDMVPEKKIRNKKPIHVKMIELEDDEEDEENDEEGEVYDRDPREDDKASSQNLDEFLRYFSNSTHHYYLNPEKKIGYNLTDMALAKNPALLKELVKFYEKFYSSNLMALVVVSNRSLDDLMDIVVPLFAQVPNKNLEAPHWPLNPYGPSQTGYHFEFKANNEKGFIMLFPCPDFSSYYRSKPWAYLTEVMDPPFENFLSKKLRNTHLANTIEANFYTPADGLAFIKIEGFLQPEGYHRTDKIIEIIFQYLNYVKSEKIREWIYRKAQETMQRRTLDSHDVIFHYKNPSASVLHRLPAKYWTNEKLIMDEHRPDLIETLLSYLNPDNFNFYLNIFNFEGKKDVQIDSYGKKYRIRKLNETFLNKLRFSEKQITWPKPNAYLPENFEILKSDDSEKSTVPKIIQESAMGRVWYMKDNFYLMPKVYLDFKLKSPVVSSSFLNNVMCQFFPSMINDALEPETMDGEFGSLQTFSTFEMDSDVSVYISGFSDKMHDFVVYVFDLMTSMKLDLNKFMKLKKSAIGWHEKAVSDLDGGFFDEEDGKTPSEIGQSFTNKLLRTPKEHSSKWSKSEVIAIENLTLQDMEIVRKEFFSNMYLELFAYGNIKKAGALKLSNDILSIIKQRFAVKPVVVTEPEKPKVIKLPEGKTFLYTTVAKDDSNLSSVTFTFQNGLFNPKISAMDELICNLLIESSQEIRRIDKRFKKFRLSSENTDGHDLNTLQITVEGYQSPEMLHSQFDLLIKAIEPDITKFTKVRSWRGEKFEGYKTLLFTLSHNKPDSMRDMSMRYFREISRGSYFFTREALIGEAMMNLMKEELTDYFKEMFDSKSPKRRKFVVYVYGDKYKNARNGYNSDMIRISNITAFKKALPFYKVPKSFTTG